MQAAAILAEKTGHLDAASAATIRRVVAKYGPIPSLEGLDARALAERMGSDKKTIQGKVHFVLPVAIGEVTIVTDVDEDLVVEAIEEALAGQVTPA